MPRRPGCYPICVNGPPWPAHGCGPALCRATVVCDRSGRVAVAFRKAVGEAKLEPVIRRAVAEPASTAGQRVPGLRSGRMVAGLGVRQVPALA